jgi:glycosyltransferase involved in cell wall biosynthesis
MNSKYILIDPCQYTPNYNNCLLDALVKKGTRIVYATTVFPHAESPVPEEVEVRYCFFYLARAVGRITSSHILRRILRAIEYPADLLFLIIHVLIKRIKLIHYMWPVLPAMDLLAIRILKCIGCRVIYTAHNPFPHEFKTSHLKTFPRIYQEVDHIIAPTNFTRNEIVKHAGIEYDKISIIGLGDSDYVLSKYESNEQLADLVRSKAEGKRVLTFLGIIRPYKGLEYFIKAFRPIKQLKPDSFFLIAGSARFESQEQLNELISRSCNPEDLQVDLRYLPLSDIKAYLSVTDVLIQPYISASQSANTVMAYSFGIPVISTDVGGLGEMVKDGETGYVIPPRDPQAIAEAVKRCFEKDNYEKLSRNAKRLAAEEYNWNDIADRTLSVYKDALGSSQGGSKQQTGTH